LGLEKRYASSAIISDKYLVVAFGLKAFSFKELPDVDILELPVQESNDNGVLSAITWVN
jgi:hypothetical protein